MKLRKIKQAMGNKTIIIVTDADGFQWVGGGMGVYLADRALDLTAENVKAILDIDEDKRDEWIAIAKNGKGLPWYDQCPLPGDMPMRAIMSVSWMDELVTIMVTSEGEAAAVTQRQIAPADGKNGLTFALRRTADPETGELDDPVVVCFSDMLANAILTPLPGKVMDEIWRKMRDASAMGMRYCREAEET